jgi:hypothetical protein
MTDDIRADHSDAVAVEIVSQLGEARITGISRRLASVRARIGGK